MERTWIIPLWNLFEICSFDLLNPYLPLPWPQTVLQARLDNVQYFSKRVLVTDDFLPVAYDSLVNPLNTLSLRNDP